MFKYVPSTSNYIQIYFTGFHTTQQIQAHSRMSQHEFCNSQMFKCVQTCSKMVHTIHSTHKGKQQICPSRMFENVLV